MKTLIDTNILVYAHDSSSAYQKSAAELVRDGLEGRLGRDIHPKYLRAVQFADQSQESKETTQPPGGSSYLQTLPGRI